MNFRKLLLIFSALAIIFLVLFGIRSILPNKAHFAQSTADNENTIDEAEAGISKDSIQNRLTAVLRGLETQQADIKVRSNADSSIDIRAFIPRGKPIELIVWQLSSALKHTSYSLKDCVCPSDTQGCKLQFVSSKYKPSVYLTLKYSQSYFSLTARMAILIEDFGFQADQTTVEYLSFPDPLTVALVPAKHLSPWTAQIANEYHKEIVILLPMEPIPRSLRKYQPTTIMLHYPEQKIRTIVSGAMQSIPYFAGMCSFWGEDVLEDSRVMSVVLSEVKKRKGYFLDTHINRKSVAPGIAKSMNVPFTGLDGILDDKITQEQVQDTLRHFALQAQKTGSVLVCSTPSTAFIKGLKAELPQLRNGIRLVYVSEIIKNQEKK